MALDFSIQPPAWLERQSEWAKGIAERGQKSFEEGALFNLKMRQGQVNMASQLLGLQQQEQQLDLTKLTIQERSKAIDEIGQYKERWMTEGKADPRWIVNNPLVSTNPTTSKWYEGAQAAANQTEVMQISRKVGQDAAKAFADRVDALREVDPVAAGKFQKFIGQATIPDDVLKTLTAQEINAKSIVERKQRELEVKAQQLETTGRKVSVVRDARGNITRVTDLGPQSRPDVKPQTMVIEGGATLAWMPGGTTLHVIDASGKKQEFTPAQLGAIAKALDDEDPRKMQIQDFLANKAVATVKGQTPAPTVPPESELVDVINPQGKAVRIKRSDLDRALKQGYKQQ